MLGFVKTRVVKTNGDFAAKGRNFAYTDPSRRLFSDSVLVSENAGGANFVHDDKRMLFFDYGLGKTCLKDLADSQSVVILENGSPKSSTFHNETVILSRRVNTPSGRVSEFALGDTKFFKPLKRLDRIDGYSLLQRWEGYLVVTSTQQNSLLGYKISDNSVVWKVDELQGQKIFEISVLFRSEHKLYLTINKHLIAEIDVRTGEVIRTWSNEYFHNPGYRLQLSEKDTMIRYGERNCLLFNKTRIGLLYSEGYREINLETGEVTQENLRQYFRDERVSPFTNTTIYTHKNLILFSSQYTNVEENRMDFSFGAFDPKTRKVVARYNFAPGEVGKGIKGPVANDQQVFILDFNNHLHLFDIV